MFFNQQKNAVLALFAKGILAPLLLIIFFVFSCSDQGCIDADDFGEYETQTLEVTSNSSADNCTYNISKSMTDASQGSGLKDCFISGNVTIYDENGASQSSTKGCMGLGTEKFKNLCANQCVANCNANVGTASAGSPEPGWIATGEKNSDANGGVTIKPNALIYIRSVGSVRLGDKLPFPHFFVSADDAMPQSKTANWANQSLDIRAGKAINLSFSGKFTDNSSVNGGATTVGEVGSGASTTLDHKVYNAARRLVAYIIPAPDSYNFDASQATEKARYINVPLLPDPNLWQCTYNGTDLTQSSCSNKSYQANGYSNVDDVLTSSTFPFTSDSQSTVLGRHGGSIRWTGDLVKPDSYDPFVSAGISCEDPTCNSSAVDPSEGVIVGDLKSRDYVLTSQVSAKVSFRFLLASSNTFCDDTLQVIIRDARDRDVYYFDGSVGNASIRSAAISVKSGAWSSVHVPIEAGQKLVIRTKQLNEYLANDGSSTNCEKALAVRFGRYKDIAITQSGMVSFANLGGIDNIGCNIKARIINPTGRRADLSANITADYYEYSDFNSPGDPLSNLNVPSIVQNNVWYSTTAPVVDNGSGKVFVRKGQIIRFSPESWNGTRNVVGGTRECGIGMAMRLEPRPALLCRGYGLTRVANPNCTQSYNSTTGVLVGCSEVAVECNDATNATYYCPSQDPKTGCVKPLTCTDGSDGGLPNNLPPIPPNTRYNCSLGARPSGCTIPTGSGATYTLAMCDACSNLRKSRAEQSATQALSNIVQCYDLENYSGKVANIPIDGSVATDAFSRGATKLESFNADIGYGNFSNFASSNQFDNDYKKNVIYQVSQPVTVTKNGRLSFLMLDGSDFNRNFLDSYADNSPFRDTKYDGSNGFKISLSSALEFFNGEWLEAKICQELKTNTMSCRSLTIDQAAILSDQPKIVELNNPTQGSFAPVSNTPFYFDSAGNLIRTRAPGPTDCAGVLSGDTYYCHTNSTVDVKKIRITFKIKDPEITTCDTANPDVANPASANGVLMSNTRFRPSDCVVGNATPDASTPKNGITVANASGASVCELNSYANKTCTPADDLGNNADGSKKYCQKEFRCVNKYANNSGKYYVTVKVKNVGSNLSNIVNSVITPVVEVMDGSKDGKKVGQAERIYKLIISDFRYQAILSTCLVVMITFYGFGYLMGVTEMNSSDLINKVIKIGLIYLFVGPEGWEWFNKIVVKFFKDGTDYLAFLMASSFDQSPELTNAINNNDFYDKSVLFGSVDRVFGIFFSSTVQKKISALLFASIFGWAYLLLIYYGMLLYIYAVANAVLLYLTSQVFISILFILGPLFFVFTLFSQTKEMFDKWLSQLISFSLQQIFLLTTLAFFNMMMYEVIKMVLGYKICWDEVWTINIITRITLMSFWTIASLPPRVNAQTDAGNIGNPDGIPSFFAILFIWVIADLMLKFVDFMTNLAASISGGLKASELGSGIKAAAGSVKGFVGARAGEIWDKTGGEAVRQLDKFLFNSGARADEDRKARQQQNAKDAAHKKAFGNAADKAVSDYKKANGEKLAGMSKEDQEKELRKVKNEAIAKEGKKRGLSEDEVDRLKKDKGFKYEGENVLGALYAAAKQTASRGGTLTGSLDDEKVKTKFSAKEAREALKNTDDIGREKIVEAAKKGDIKVGKSGWENFKDKAAKVATLGIPAAARAVSKTVKDQKDYYEAMDQLIAEGVVPKMAKGTSGALPSELKEKIRERRDLNRKQRGEDGSNRSSANTVAKLSIEADILNELESAGDGDFVREDGAVAALIGRRPIVSDVMSRFSRSAQIKQERSAMSKTEVKAKWDQAEENFEMASEEYDKFDADIKATTEDPEFEAKTKRSSQLRAQIADPKLSRDDRSKARQELSAIKGDKKFQDQTQKLKRDLVARNQAFNAKANYKEAAEKFEDQYKALEAKGASGPKLNLSDSSDDDSSA